MGEGGWDSPKPRPPDSPLWSMRVGRGSGFPGRRRWVHAVCQGLSTEDEVEVAADEGFDCSLCRTHGPDTKTYTQDGVCLTESGLSHLQSLVEPLTSPRRYRRCKPKLKLRIINQNSVSVLQTPDPDPLTEQDHSRGDLECEMKSDSSPERDHAHGDDVTKGPEVTDGNKKRKRKPYRPGIGGFMVRQRGGRSGPSRIKLCRKDSAEALLSRDEGTFQVERSPSPFAGLDIMADDPSLTGSGRGQRVVQEEPLDAILSPELDKMVTDGAILSKLYKIPASANQGPAGGEGGDQDVMSTAQRSMLKWEKEETLGEMATVAPVLYCNTNFPQLKEHGCVLTVVSVRQQKARDNRAAQRINKVQLSNDPLKRHQPLALQQQQHPLPPPPPGGPYDPVSMDTEGAFKDPLRPKESEQEQEWKLRQGEVNDRWGAGKKRQENLPQSKVLKSPTDKDCPYQASVAGGGKEALVRSQGEPVGGRRPGSTTSEIFFLSVCQLSV
ncbi:Histone-lysine N-methyltransferase 2C [Larimichthys crocea]|nr:Histone-lysine N-methyltransferase 2C [Larimichthys crocea]